MFRQRIKLDPNRFNFYEQRGVVVKNKTPLRSDSNELNPIWFISGFKRSKQTRPHCSNIRFYSSKFARQDTADECLDDHQNMFIIG